MLGRVLLRDEVGRDDGATGLSDGKKLDLRLRGDGEGGIWDKVSIVLSDKEGLERRGSVRDFVWRSAWTSSMLPATDVSTSIVVVVLVEVFPGCPGKAGFLIEYLAGSGG